jgi:hypothetical protein
MRNQLTVICDDIRNEAGNKLSLMGLYHDEIRLERLPGRLHKLCIYQRWVEVQGVAKVRVELRGSALGIGIRAELVPSGEFDPSKPHVQLLVAFGPIDFLNEGNIVFETYISSDTIPDHVHTIQVKGPGNEPGAAQDFRH